MKKFFLLLLSTMLLTSCSQVGPQGPQGEQGIQGEKGDPGKDGSSPEIIIGDNGNWFIDGTDTGVKASGDDGYSPTIEIGSNGNWFVDGVDTGYFASGQNGETPYIGDNGNWWIGETDTGVSAQGPQGDSGVKGETGEDGLTPYIGDNGNWWIGETDTGVSAQGPQGDSGVKGETGEDGLTPYIGDNGNWWIGETDTGVSAQGPQGDSGVKGETGEDGLTPYIGENGNWRIGESDTGVPAQGSQGETGEKGDKGEAGEDGKTPYIGDNGNWWIGETDTGVSAKGSQGQTGEKGDKGEAGEDGDTPYIGENGNWWIGETDTGVSAQGPQGDKGEKGEDGLDGENGQTPHIGINGNWFIGDRDTGIKAEGVDGNNGSEWLFGHGAPNQEIGRINDLYLDQNNYDLYKKETTGWILIGNIKGEDYTPTKEIFRVELFLNNGNLNASTTIEVEEGTCVELPLPYYYGYRFDGRYTGKSINDTKFSNDIPVTANLTLIAKRTKISDISTIEDVKDSYISKAYQLFYESIGNNPNNYQLAQLDYYIGLLNFANSLAFVEVEYNNFTNRLDNSFYDGSALRKDILSKWCYFNNIYVGLEDTYYETFSSNLKEAENLTMGEAREFQKKWEETYNNIIVEAGKTNLTEEGLSFYKKIFSSALSALESYSDDWFIEFDGEQLTKAEVENKLKISTSFSYSYCKSYIEDSNDKFFLELVENDSKEMLKNQYVIDTRLELLELCFGSDDFVSMPDFATAKGLIDQINGAACYTEVANLFGDCSEAITEFCKTLDESNEFADLVNDKVTLVSFYENKVSEVINENQALRDDEIEYENFKRIVDSDIEGVINNEYYNTFASFDSFCYEVIGVWLGNYKFNLAGNFGYNINLTINFKNPFNNRLTKTDITIKEGFTYNFDDFFEVPSGFYANYYFDEELTKPITEIINGEINPLRDLDDKSIYVSYSISDYDLAKAYLKIELDAIHINLCNQILNTSFYLTPDSLTTLNEYYADISTYIDAIDDNTDFENFNGELNNYINDVNKYLVEQGFNFTVEA